MSVKKQFGSFDELLESSELPVLVDFYAPWCGPCQLMTKILDKVSETMKDKVQIVKINTDNYPDLASQYKVYALPTLVLFKNGEPVDRFEGVIQADKLCDRLAVHA
jgi:thioredoxin